MKSDRPATIHTCSPTVKSVFSPVILVSLSVTTKTKLAAFDHGVDGILAVPFSPEELGARVLAVMRRTYHETMVFTLVLRLGDLEIDILNHSVRTHADQRAASGSCSAGKLFRAHACP
jgi:DNA-binding response OmpR family regulator